MRQNGPANCANQAKFAHFAGPFCLIFIVFHYNGHNFFSGFLELLLGFLSQRAEILGKWVKNGSKKICKSRFSKFGRGPQISAIQKKKGPKMTLFVRKWLKSGVLSKIVKICSYRFFCILFQHIFLKFQAPTSKTQEECQKPSKKSYDPFYLFV